MPYNLEDLEVNRVDFVDEGANSAAFIKIFKRKEQPKTMDFSEILGKLKPAHADVVKKHVDGLADELAVVKTDLEQANATIEKQASTINETNEALSKANEELETLKAAGDVCTCGGEADANGVCTVCGKASNNSLSFDEDEVLKSMPEGIRQEYQKMRAQKDAAEELVRKAAEEKAEAEAVAKANTLKALPVEQEVLVGILKNCDPTVIEVLSTAAAAIEGTMLSEVGKAGQGSIAVDAWDKIEAEAAKISATDNVTKQKAISMVIKNKPELYKEYLNGGTN